MVLTTRSLNGRNFCHISPVRVEFVVCIDVHFALNRDKSSRAEILAMMSDILTGTVNVIYYVTLKSRRICKSVLATDLFALVDVLDIWFTILHALTEKIKRNINLIIYADRRFFCSLCILLAHTTEWCPRVVLSLIRGDYERSNIHDIIRVSGKHNPADDLTKTGRRGDPLKQLITTNYFWREPECWITIDGNKVERKVCSLEA